MLYRVGPLIMNLYIVVITTKLEKGSGITFQNEMAPVHGYPRSLLTIPVQLVL